MAEKFRIRRGAAVLLGGAAIAAHGVAVLFIWRSPEMSALAAWNRTSFALVWIPWAAIAIMIALRGVRTAGASMMALAMALIALSDGIWALWDAVPGFPRWLLSAATITVSFAGAGAYLRASQLFPRPLTRVDLFAPDAPWSRLPPVRHGLAALLRPWATWLAAALWVAGSLSPATRAVSAPALIVLGAVYLHVSFKTGTPKTRRRITWLLQTALAFAFLFLLGVALSQLLATAGAARFQAHAAIALNVAMAIACCGSMAMGVFGAGAVNPTLVVRATVAWGAAVTGLLFALNVIASVLVDVAVDAFGLSDRVVAAMLGTIAGLLLEPVAARLRRLLDRFGQPAQQAGSGQAALAK